ncbi:MAG TPA: hypothetical protein VF765_23580 [Polyangiaceae bacterium]
MTRLAWGLAFLAAACVPPHPATPVAMDVGPLRHVEFPGPPERTSGTAVVSGASVTVATATYVEYGDAPVLLRARSVALDDVVKLDDEDAPLLCEPLAMRLGEIGTVDGQPVSIGELPGCTFQVELPRRLGRRPKSLLREGAHVSLRIAVGHSAAAVLMAATVRGSPPDADAKAGIDRFFGSAHIVEGVRPGRDARSAGRGAVNTQMIEDLAAALVGDLTHE